MKSCIPIDAWHRIVFFVNWSYRYCHFIVSMGPKRLGRAAGPKVSVLSEKYGVFNYPPLDGKGKSGLTPLTPGPFALLTDRLHFDECMISNSIFKFLLRCPRSADFMSTAEELQKLRFAGISRHTLDPLPGWAHVYQDLPLPNLVASRLWGH